MNYKQEAEALEKELYTSGKPMVEVLARFLAEHDAKLLENSAAEYKAGLFSFPLQSYLYRRAAQIRKEAGL